jgi:GNAT superfamily N-acetyltransferase
MKLTHDPPLPARAVEGASFLQRVALLDGRRLVGAAAWYLPAGDDGAAQLVDLVVEPELRRKGHGGTLLDDAIAQARALCKLRRIPLRRLWVAVEHVRQVNARSFLTKHGFHHTSTIPDLLRKQDLLVYVRSFD